MTLTTMLGVARRPQHYHLHFNKNVNEKEKHERVHPKPLNPIMQDHNEGNCNTMIKKMCKMTKREGIRCKKFICRNLQK
jgi:hypothetical protein